MVFSLSLCILPQDYHDIYGLANTKRKNISVAIARTIRYSATMRKKEKTKKAVKGLNPALGGYENDLKETGLAAKRLDEHGRAAWLLDLAYLDLSALSQGQRADKQFEVYAFGLPRNIAELKGDRLTDARALLDVLTHAGKLVEDFQKQLHDKFEDTKKGHAWEWTHPERYASFTLFNVKSTEGLGGRQRGGSMPAAVDHLMSLATELVERERDKFGICQSPRCGKPFVSQRKGRVKFSGKVQFCSTKCSAYVRVTKARGKL